MVSDLVVTITTTITKSKCTTKTILKLNQNTENYIKTVTKTMLKLKQFSMLSCSPFRVIDNIVTGWSFITVQLMPEKF